MSMNVNNVYANYGTYYGSKSASEKKDAEQLANSPKKKDLGVIVEISKESEIAAKMTSAVSNRDRKNTVYQHRIIEGSNADGMVSFYGASVTKEQSEQLQSIIRDLEQQGYVSATPDEQGNYQKGDEALGASWEPGTYAQAGLKVSQLSYACEKMGLSAETTEQISSAYSNQIQEKINKVNGMMDALAAQMEVQMQELHKMVEKQGINPYKAGNRAENTTGKSSVELNQEVNSDIYKMFSNLDTGSKEAFQNSFQEALGKFHSYWESDPIETYTGTERESIQLEALTARFNDFLKS